MSRMWAHSDAADPDRVLDLCEFTAFAETSEHAIELFELLALRHSA